MNAGRSLGWRLVTQLPSSTTSRFTQMPPALRMSSWNCKAADSRTRKEEPMTIPGSPRTQILDCLVNYFGLDEGERPGCQRYFCYHVLAGPRPRAGGGIA